MPKKKILIVGGGVAGTSLMWQLLKEDCDVKMIHKKNSPMCSIAASGIINPITGRKVVLAWKALEVLNFCTTFYNEIETILNSKIIIHQTIHRNISNQQELNNWKTRSEEATFKTIFKIVNEPISLLKKPSLGTVISNGLIIDTNNFIKNSHKFFEANELFINGFFNNDSNLINEFDHVIYCNGSALNNFKKFSFIPNKLNKGEALLFKKNDNSTISNPLKSKTFLIPQANKQLWVGSYNDWDDKTWNPSEDAFENLAQELDNTFEGDFKYIKGIAGLRVGIPDRRPVVGWKDSTKKYGLFNGFGTKGFSLAPFLAKHFCEHIFNDASLWEEITLERFRK